MVSDMVAWILFGPYDTAVFSYGTKTSSTWLLSHEDRILEAVHIAMAWRGFVVACKTRAETHTYTCVFTHSRTCVCSWTQAYTGSHTRTYAITNAYARAYTHAHTCVRTRSSTWSSSATLHERPTCVPINVLTHFALTRKGLLCLLP